ncbi:MAG: SDR family NAD(P)-dependent oxidoreductase, partial [Acidimicrobiia bacterium]
AAAGAAVLIADVREAEGLETAEAINAAGGTATCASVAVTYGASTERLAAEAVAELGGIDILVNNAAIFAGLTRTPLTELPVDRWTRLMEVNVTGVFLCTRAVVPAMRARGGGAIVNQSSIAAFGGHGGGMLDYATSKAAVIGFTKSAAKDLGADHIRVNAICPGGVASEAALELAGGNRDAIQRYASETQLIPEVIEPDDLVGPLLFLVSDAAKFMTGQTIVVDGGRYFLG